MASHLPHACVSGWPPRRVDAGVHTTVDYQRFMHQEKRGYVVLACRVIHTPDVSSTTNVDNQTQPSAIPSDTTRFTLSALSSRLYSHHEGRNRRNDSYQHECRQKT